MGITRRGQGPAPSAEIIRCKFESSRGRHTSDTNHPASAQQRSVQVLIRPKLIWMARPTRSIVAALVRPMRLISRARSFLSCHPERGPARERIKPAFGLTRWLARVEGPALHYLRQHRKTRKTADSPRLRSGQTLRLRARPTRAITPNERKSGARWGPRRRRVGNSLRALRSE